MNPLHPLLVLWLAIAFVIALVWHEFARAWVAGRLGDHTPRQMGRQSLNPKAHFDTFGSVILPAILLLPVLFAGGAFVFGYAKPMPVNTWNLRKTPRDVVLTALAGPAANLLLAVAFGVALSLSCAAGALADFLSACVIVNVILCVFNLLPIPGLDGARAIAPFLPPRAREVFTNLEQYLPLFLILVVFILRGSGLVDFVDAVATGILRLLPGANCL